MSAVLLAQGALMRGFNPPGTVPNNIMISLSRGCVAALAGGSP